MKKRSMKKWIIMVMCCLLVALIGGIVWLNHISFRPDSPILVESSSSPSYGCYTDFYTTHVRVYNDGTVDIYGSFEEEAYIEGVTFQISEQEVEEVRKVMDRHPFLWMKEELPDYGVCDGSYYWLTIYDENEEPIASVGGLESSDLAYNMVATQVDDVIPDGYRREAKEKIHTYVLENYGEE